MWSVLKRQALWRERKRKKAGREGRKEGGLGDKTAGQVRVRECGGQVGGRAAVVAGSRQRKPLGLQEARGPHLEARAGGRWWRLGASDKVATKE